MVGAQPQAVLLLAQGLRQDGDLGAERVRELDGHVAEAAEADHPAPVARVAAWGTDAWQGRMGGGENDPEGDHR